MTKSFSLTIDSTRETPAATTDSTSRPPAAAPVGRNDVARRSGNMREDVCSRHPCG